MSVMISYLSYCHLDTLYKTRNCETLSQSPAPCLIIRYTTAVPDGMIKGGITQIGMAQRIAYPYSHFVSFILSSLVEVSSFILSNNHTFIHVTWVWVCQSAIFTYPRTPELRHHKHMNVYYILLTVVLMAVLWYFQ